MSNDAIEPPYVSFVGRPAEVDGEMQIGATVRVDLGYTSAGAHAASIEVTVRFDRTRSVGDQERAIMDAAREVIAETSRRLSAV
jgi:hypothetical protein